MRPTNAHTCLILCIALAGLAAGAAARKNPRKLKSDPNQEYYVYLPRDFDPERTYWLFVGVHGLGGNGKGALGWERFADEGQCIVLGPTFTGTFQFPSKGAGEKMKAILRELAKQHKFQRKIFLTGFSAGAQFAHRFSLENPQLVVGCAAHSAGSWSSPSPKARTVPFLVTCGTADKQHDRIGIAKQFVRELQQKRFKVESKWFEGVGHSFCKEAREMTREFYWKLTTGMSPQERERIAGDLEKADKLISEGEYAEAAPLLKKIAASRRGTDYGERAAAAIRKIEKIGKERLAAADEQAKTDADAAIAALEKMQEDFKGTRVATAAARRLRTLQSASKAVSSPKQETDEPGREPASPPASKAESDCRRWMTMARNYVANRRPEKARQYLEKIVNTYPDSAHAEKARKMLREL
jgi:acetyl esterase/lipase